MSLDPQSATDWLTDLEQQIVRTVIDRFLNLHEATIRKSLEVKFKDLDAIARLIRYGLISLNEPHLPTPLGLQLCATPDQLGFAKTSFEKTLYVLRNLYENDTEGHAFTFDQIEAHAKSIYDNGPQNTISVGLAFVAETPALDGWSGSNRLRLENVRISHRIIRIKKIEDEWDRVVRTRLRFLEEARSPKRCDALIAVLGQVADKNTHTLDQPQADQAAYSAGYQGDEISHLFESLEKDGLIVSDSKADSIVLTDAAIARAKLIQRQATEVATQSERETTAVGDRRVFVVHGRNTKIRQTLVRFLKSLRLQPIVLQAAGFHDYQHDPEIRIFRERLCCMSRLPALFGS